MALTSAQQNDLFKLTVGLFNAAPGSFYTEVEGIMIGSQTPAAAAQVLIGTPAFQAILPSQILTNTQFATKFLDMLVGSTVSDANKAWAVAQMDAKLNNGETQGAVAWWAIDELSKVPTSNADWGTAAATLTNKLDVAKYFTVDKYVASNSVATLQGLLVDVTSDVATVAVAKANATSNAIALTTGVGETVGTSGADTFQAFLANGANTLQSGDLIRGGAGSDTLMADISTQGTGENAIAFSSQSVEKVMLRAQHSDTDNNNGDNNLGAAEVAIDAERATGVNVWENYNSRADLIVEDVRIGASQITKDITIVMRETDPGHADYGVYFDQNSLRNVSSATSQINLQVMDTRAVVAGQDPLKNSPYKGFQFTSTNTTTGVATVVVLQSQAINDAQTYAQLQAAFQAAADAQFGAGAVTVSVGSSYTANDTQSGTQVSGNEIVLATTGSFTFSTPAGSGWIADGVVPADSGLHTFFSSGGTTSTALVTSTIVLDDVGRGSTGGDLVVGGLSVGDTSTSKGVQRFEITVEDNSKLQTIASTNNTLREVTIVNGTTTRSTDAYTTTVTNAGNLTVLGTVGGETGFNTALPGTETSGDQHGAYGFSDVRLIDGSAMTGMLTFDAVITKDAIAKYVNLVDTDANPTADTVAVAYSGGANNDSMTVDLDVDAVASHSKVNVGREDFTFTFNGNNGNDVIDIAIDRTATILTGDTQAWYANQVINNNITINGGAGNDTIRTPGAGNMTINAGSGDDAVYTDNTGRQGVAALDNTGAATAVTSNAVFVFNTDVQGADDPTAQNLYDLVSDPRETVGSFGVDLTVTYRGLTSTVALADTDYRLSDLEVNQAIKKAINSDAVLSKLLVAEDGPSGTLIVTSLTDGVRATADLGISFSTVAGADFGAANVTAYNTANGTALANEAALAADINTNIGNMALNYVTQTADSTAGVEIVGANSTTTSDNVITGAEGNDVIVLGTTNDGATALGSSNETVVYSAAFGNDTIVNFVDATAAGNFGDDVFDFRGLNGDVTTQAALTFAAAGAVADKSIAVVAVVADDGDNVAEAGETWNAASLKLTLDAAGGSFEDGTASNHVYIAYNATTGVGSVYTVADGAAADDTTVTLVGTIDLADTAWAGLTIANFA